MQNDKSNYHFRKKDKRIWLITSTIFCCLNRSVWVINHTHSFAFIFYLHQILKIFQNPLDRKKPERIPARDNILLPILHAAANWYVVVRIFSRTVLLFMQNFFRWIIICLVIRISIFIFIVILTTFRSLNFLAFFRWLSCYSDQQTNPGLCIKEGWITEAWYIL